MNQNQRDSWLAQFLSFLSKKRHYSIHTIQNYRRDIHRFYSFMDRHQLVSLTDITQTNARHYLRTLTEQGLANRTVNRHIASLRSYWSYLTRNTIVTTAIWDTITPPKIRPSLPDIIYPHEMDTFLSMIDTTTPAGIRDRCICELLYATGMRVSELIQLKQTDINYDDGEALVHGKGNKERYVFFGPSAKRWVAVYCEEIRYQFEGIRSPFVFLNQRGGQLTTRSIQRMIQRISRQFNKPITPHTFRHSFATDMLNGGAD